MDDVTFVRQIKDRIEQAYGGPVELQLIESGVLEMTFSDPPRIGIGREVLQSGYATKLREYLECVRLGLQLRREPTDQELHIFMQRN